MLRLRREICEICEICVRLGLAAEAVTEGEAFFVEGFEFTGIAADAVHLHRTLRTDADDLAPVFHTLDEIQLFVVGLDVMAQDDTQTGILLVKQPWCLEVGLLRTEASVARHDDHVG